ncbi:MAG: hypothetical protein DRJ03_30695 [Chloroflexi bacterium]|nr:MAG: hypothetical protein DRJ03_30695 [Chloroflexota bacterium]
MIHRPTTILTRNVIVALLLATALVTGCAPQVQVVEVTATPMPTSPPTATPAPTTVTVCASGCDFTTIQAAIHDFHTIAGSTINVTDGVHTEANIIVNKDITIQGQGAESTIVQAHDSVDAAAGRVFFITDGATVTIRGMTIRHGNPPEHLRTGGGIYNDYFCALTLQDSVVADNVASDGAGISNRGVMTITRCIVSGNVADGIEEPGHQCGNGGGVKAVATATTVIINTTITGNHAVSRGGGIKSNCDGTMEIINSTISGNTAGSSIAGIYARGTVTITNSTIVGNDAAGMGRHAGNASGICVRDLVNLVNTIIANNGGGQDCGLCESAGVYGSIGVNVNNLIGDGSCHPDYAGDPMLGPLADNGGSTQTHAPLPGSPAIDAIPTDECLVGADQRGKPRPQGTGCDIGAYELQTNE